MLTSSDESSSQPLLSGWPVPFINPFINPSAPFATHFAIPASSVAFIKAPHAPKPHAPGGAKPPKGGSGKLHGAGNCGSGHGGFKPGNTCGRSGRAKLADHFRNARKSANHSDAHPDAARKVRLAARELRHHRRGKSGAVDRETAKAHIEAIRSGKVPEPKHIPKRKPMPKTKPMDRESETIKLEKPESSYHEHTGTRQEKVDGDNKFKEEFEPWAKSLSTHEKNAIEEFIGDGYADINNVIFGKYHGSDRRSINKDIDHIESALSRTKLHTDTVLFRGIDGSGLRAMGISDPSTLIPGQALHMAGFKSTSLSPLAASNGFTDRNGALLRILADSGTKGAYINGNGLSTRNHEKEFLLPQSVQKFVVVGVHENPHGGMLKDSSAKYMVTLRIHQD